MSQAASGCSLRQLERSYATSYFPIAGEGSRWAANAVQQWIADVMRQLTMRVSYTQNGSTAGRAAFMNGTTDFAVSDLPFQSHPTDGSALETPSTSTYTLVPPVPGGLAFAYHLDINWQAVTNLSFPGANVARMFTGVITNWDDPALASDNPGFAAAKPRHYRLYEIRRG